MPDKHGLSMEKKVLIMGKEYIPLFLDFNETTQDLADDECGRLIRAIVSYANDEEYESILKGNEKVAFRFLKGLVDRNAAISEKRAQARAGKNKTEQNETNDNKEEQNETNSITKTKTKTETNTKNKNQNTSPLFDRFWDAYPRHVNKQGAAKAFERAKIDDQIIDEIITAIEKQKKSDQWTKDNGQFIPHPATWLNQRRWEDEITPARTGKVLPAQDFQQRDYSEVDNELMQNLAKEMEEYKAQQGVS